MEHIKPIQKSWNIRIFPSTLITRELFFIPFFFSFLLLNEWKLSSFCSCPPLLDLSWPNLTRYASNPPNKLFSLQWAWFLLLLFLIWKARRFNCFSQAHQVSIGLFKHLELEESDDSERRERLDNLSGCVQYRKNNLATHVECWTI